MDWNKIERDLKYQTTNLLQNKLNYKEKEQEKEDKNEEKQSFLILNNQNNLNNNFKNNNNSNNSNNSSNNNLSNYTNTFNPYNNHNNIEINSYLQPKFDYIINDINEVKDFILKQNDKIRNMENIIENTILTNSKYEFLKQRFEQIENENKLLMKQLANLSRENSDYIVYSKELGGKMQFLEELVRTTSNDCVSKSAFSQFLETCSEQLKAVHTTTELARSNTSLCMSFLDSFMIALNQLQGNNSPSIVGLEYLTTLGSSVGGREKQSTQIINLLRSALVTTISHEVESCTTRIQNIAISSTDEMRKDLASAMEEIKEEVLRHGQGMSDEVMKSAESTAHNISDLTKQIDRIRRKIDADAASFREGHQVMELEIAEIKQSIKKTDESCSKILNISIPTAQRNHKALLDEVLRIEESNAQITTKIETNEKNWKKLENQYLSVSTAHANIIKLMQEEREERERDRERDQEKEKERREEREEWRKISDKVQRELNSKKLQNENISTQPIATCLECNSLKTQVSVIDEKVNRLANTLKTLDDGMNSLQTEFASLYEEIEEKKNEKQDSKFLESTSINDQLIELQNRLSSMERTVNPLESRFKLNLEQVKKKIDELIDQERKLREEGDKVTQLKVIEQEEKFKESLSISERKVLMLLSDQEKKMKESIEKFENEQQNHKKIDGTENIQTDIKAPKEEKSNIITQTKISDDLKKHQETIELQKAESERKIKQRMEALQKDEGSEESSFLESDDNDEEDEEEDNGNDTHRNSNNRSYLPQSTIDKGLITKKFAESDDDDDNEDEDDEQRKNNQINNNHLHNDKKNQNKEDQDVDEEDEDMDRSFDDEDNGDEDDDENDNLSVRSSDSEENDRIRRPMSEINKIEDSLDESIGAIESMKQSTKLQTPNITFEIDSLGNMVPVTKKINQSESNSKTTITTNNHNSNLPSSTITPNPNLTNNMTISSGSLLGSGGRNKSAPLQSSNPVPVRGLNISLPAPPSNIPLPPATPTSSASPSIVNSRQQHNEDSAQCTFCLRRFNIEELKSHLKVCELRTELCRYGCRSRIMASKMEKHYDICPNNPKNKE